MKNSNWKVTKLYQLDHKLIIHLTAPDLPPAKVIWNGSTRRYEYDGWELLLDHKHHAGVDKALRNYFEGGIMQ
jgi:hypothetical protein